MPTDRERQLAVDYARKYWNRAVDERGDEVFWETTANVSVSSKRKQFDAPLNQGWVAFFIFRDGQENAVFARTGSGTPYTSRLQELVETKPDSIAQQDVLDDCTHYVSSCLRAEGLDLPLGLVSADNLVKGMQGKITDPTFKDKYNNIGKKCHAKILAVAADQAGGQTVIDSGIFEPGDAIGYLQGRKDRYGHTSMYIGKLKADDPGRMTCHTVCRYGGLTQAWNGASDDFWYIHSGSGPYTFIHFSENDKPFSAFTQRTLPGWWQVGTAYYKILDDGSAYLTSTRPRLATDPVRPQDASAHYFQGQTELVFIWQNRTHDVWVENWTQGGDNRQFSITISGSSRTSGTAVRLF